MPTQPASPPRAPLNRIINQKSYQLAEDDAEQIITVTYSGGAVTTAATAQNFAATILIPADATVLLPVGTSIIIIDDSPAYVFIQAAAGVSLFWNAADRTVVDNSSRAGGAGQRTRPSGRLSKSTLVKQAANTWQLFQS